MRSTIHVRTELYTDSDARNWLTVNDCLLTPTKLGGLEIVFDSEQTLLEFCLRWAHYVCERSTT